MSAKESSKSSRGSAALFYFKWTRTTLDAYAKTVRERHLNPLLVKCARVRMGFIEEEDDEIKPFDFTNLTANSRTLKNDKVEIRKMLGEALTVVREDVVAKPKPTISMAELTAAYRLRILLEMCVSLTEVIRELASRVDSDKTVFTKSEDINKIFTKVRIMFEAACAMGEVFEMTSVDWKDCKYAKLLDPTSKEYCGNGDSLLVVGKPEEYIPPLMTRINYLRVIVSSIANAINDIIEIVFNKENVPNQQREITAILEDLPIRFLKVKETSSSMSPRTRNILGLPVKSLFEQKYLFTLPIVPPRNRTDSSSTTQQSTKSGKITSHKYLESRSTQKTSSPTLKSQKTQETKSLKSRSQKSSAKRKNVKDKSRK